MKKTETNIKTRILLHYIYLSFLLLTPIVLVLLPTDFFDNGRKLCLSVVLFNQTCAGCGMTRAIQHLIHFDFEGAYAYNKLSFIVFPLLVVVWMQEIMRTKRKINVLNKCKNT
ncbi:MAG: DUF2752 domain-containing protein [Bacteroidia bacterium]|nr:DUF2752 domain-containing protein [Bacteroidia bacterium]